MLNQKSFHIDGSTHSPFNQTYVERHEFKDHSPPARFRRIKAKQPLSGTRAHDFEACFRENLQRVYQYRKQVLAIFDGLVSNEQMRPRLQ